MAQLQLKKPLGERDQKRLNDMLIIHSWKFKTQRVEKLLDMGAQLEYEPGNGWTPLFNVAYTGDKRTFVMLIRRGANIDQTDGTGRKVTDYANHSAVKRKNKPFLRFLKFARESMDRRDFNHFISVFGECVGWV
jgi:hypothetical protein